MGRWFGMALFLLVSACSDQGPGEKPPSAGPPAVPSLADLEGQWALTRFSRDEEVSPDIDITLQIEGDQISGKAGCNRYNGRVAEGSAPGGIGVAGPLASTRMMCPPPLMDAEQRYLTALQGITGFSFIAGNLVLSGSSQGEDGTLWFRRLSPAGNE